MRLRRETGDFSVKFVDNEAKIRTNLFPEQLLGQIIEDGDKLLVVVGVVKGEDSLTIKTVDGDYTYVAETGVVAKG